MSGKRCKWRVVVDDDGVLRWEATYRGYDLVVRSEEGVGYRVCTRESGSAGEPAPSDDVFSDLALAKRFAAEAVRQGAVALYGMNCSRG